jgi:hypothetical protein
VILRPLGPHDLEGLGRLCAAHAAYERSAFAESGQEQRWAALFFGDRPRAFCLVVEDGGALVGYATWSLELSTWDAAEHVHVDCLFFRLLAGRGCGYAIKVGYGTWLRSSAWPVGNRSEAITCPFARSGSIPGIRLSSRVATIPPPGRPVSAV